VEYFETSFFSSPRKARKNSRRGPPKVRCGNPPLMEFPLMGRAKNTHRRDLDQGTSKIPAGTGVCGIRKSFSPSSETTTHSQVYFVFSFSPCQTKNPPEMLIRKDPPPPPKTFFSLSRYSCNRSQKRIFSPSVSPFLFCLRPPWPHDQGPPLLPVLGVFLSPTTVPLKVPVTFLT